MQQDSALKQRKSRLSIGTPFDPFYFIDEPLNHPVAPGQTTSVGNSLRIIVQPISKSDQFRNSTGPDCGFPLLQTHLPFALAQQVAKILRQLEHDRDGLVALDESVQIGR